MRKQDHWLHLAGTLGMPATTVVSVCTFLNMKRAPVWISEKLSVPLKDVFSIKDAAAPFLRAIVEERS